MCHLLLSTYCIPGSELYTSHMLSLCLAMLKRSLSSWAHLSWAFPLLSLPLHPENGADGSFWNEPCEDRGSWHKPCLGKAGRRSS